MDELTKVLERMPRLERKNVGIAALYGHLRVEELNRRVVEPNETLPSQR